MLIVGAIPLLVIRPSKEKGGPVERQPRIVQLDPAKNYDYRVDVGEIVLPTMSGGMSEPVGKATNEWNWVGAQACAECHEKHWNSARETPHFVTSQPASVETVHGPFSAGRNELITADSKIKFAMSREGERLYQAVTWNDDPIFRAAFDVVLGSGRNIAQSYGYWTNHALLELPVTYHAPSGQWINSPGYKNGTAVFTRPIPNGCLSCHVTAWDPIDDDPFSFGYRSRKIIHGVTCEKCHGAGRQHVEFHRANPTAPAGRHILAPGELTAEKSNGLCAECHGRAKDPDAKVGVHTNNQLQRLKESECFKQSGGLRCTDCHNPHRFERGDYKLAASRCQSCHELKDCKAVEPERHQFFSERCILCHMKREALADVSIFITNEVVIPDAFDHFIRVLKPSEIKDLAK